MHERKWGSDGQLLYHERQLTAIAVQVKADVCLSSIDDTVAVTREVWETSSRACLPMTLFSQSCLLLMTTKGDCDFEDLLACLYTGWEQCHVVFDNIRSFVKFAGFFSFKKRLGCPASC